MSRSRYFFFSFPAALGFASLFPLLVPVPAEVLVVDFAVRLYRSEQNALMSAGSPSRNGASLSCNDEGDFAEVAVARTKSTTVGSDAPVRRRRESETNVRCSILRLVAVSVRSVLSVDGQIVYEGVQSF
ncbi:hypothetical protein BJY04DRAFT_191415 [Aspergillus karnatakaensis]|uniref:uncharacterized protein n=1 Tax=Aspergillus karnatakaensis TaxID=1810916 RepID=UPI003CCD7A60